MHYIQMFMKIYDKVSFMLEDLQSSVSGGKGKIK